MSIFGGLFGIGTDACVSILHKYLLWYLRLFSLLVSASEAMVAASILPAMVSYLLQLLSLSFCLDKYRASGEHWKDPVTEMIGLSSVTLNVTSDFASGSVRDSRSFGTDPPIVFELYLVKAVVLFCIFCLIYKATHQIEHTFGIVSVIIMTLGMRRMLITYTVRERKTPLLLLMCYNLWGESSFCILCICDSNV